MVRFDTMSERRRVCKDCPFSRSRSAVVEPAKHCGYDEILKCNQEYAGRALSSLAEGTDGFGETMGGETVEYRLRKKDQID